MDVVALCAQLEKQYEEFKEDFLKSPTNQSASARARRKSVEIRESYKSIRSELLKTIKEKKGKL
jgi:hypothetical protein